MTASKIKARRLTFSSLARATAGLPADYRCRIFASLPAPLQQAAWRALADECGARNAALNEAAGDPGIPGSGIPVGDRRGDGRHA